MSLGKPAAFLCLITAAPLGVLVVEHAENLRLESFGRLLALLVLLCWPLPRSLSHLNAVRLACAGPVLVGELVAHVPGRQAIWYWLLCTVPTVAAWLLSGPRFRTRLSTFEVVLLGTCCATLGMSAGATAFFEMEASWVRNLHWVAIPTVWIAGRRIFTEDNRIYRIVVAGVAAAVLVTGLLRIGSAYYHHSVALNANAPAAIDHYGKSLVISRALGWLGLRDDTLVSLAKAHYGEGQVLQATSLLGVDDRWKRTVAAEDWRGPTGSQLFKNVACWIDLYLADGEVAIDIQATGNPARGEQPRMQAFLGDNYLGEVNIEPGPVRSYSYTATVASGRHRLMVRLVNDFWEPGVGDRWIRLGQASVVQRSVLW